jgi:uncharacterized protein
VSTLTVSPTALFRFLLRVHGLAPESPCLTVADAVQSLEFVQEDSINICGRMHDLTLLSRIPDYASERLAEALYGPQRCLFEDYFPNLSALPLSDYRYFVRRRIARQQSGHWHSLTSGETPVAEELLARMKSEGPLRARESGDHHGHTTSGWGMRQKVTARVLEKLWLQGRILVERRENFERWFQRREDLVPELTALHEDPSLWPSPEEERWYLTRKRLRARRLFRLKKDEKEIMGKDALVTVQVEGQKERGWYVLAEDAALLAQAESLPVLDGVHLLAPLDPFIYDRARNTFFGGDISDYTWEVYTPEAKRRWGYYVLPILHGDRLIGFVDPKIDRKAKTLLLNVLTLEPDVEVSEVIEPLMERLRAYARWLGAERIAVTSVSSDTLRACAGPVV